MEVKQRFQGAPRSGLRADPGLPLPPKLGLNFKIRPSGRVSGGTMTGADAPHGVEALCRLPPDLHPAKVGQVDDDFEPPHSRGLFRPAIRSQGAAGNHDRP